MLVLRTEMCFSICDDSSEILAIFDVDTIVRKTSVLVLGLAGGKPHLMLVLRTEMCFSICDDSSEILAIFNVDTIVRKTSFVVL
ncbi:hypothetical protein J6590_047936 [Homalodisca vitripennis]|nr:hypothetical protein J6590_047936 [Homalodisca vitripennis]